MKKLFKSKLVIVLMTVVMLVGAVAVGLASHTLGDSHAAAYKPNQQNSDESITPQSSQLHSGTHVASQEGVLTALSVPGVPNEYTIPDISRLGNNRIWLRFISNDNRVVAFFQDESFFPADDQGHRHYRIEWQVFQDGTLIRKDVVGDWFQDVPQINLPVNDLQIKGAMIHVFFPAGSVMPAVKTEHNLWGRGELIEVQEDGTLRVIG